MNHKVKVELTKVAGIYSSLLRGGRLLTKVAGNIGGRRRSIASRLLLRRGGEEEGRVGGPRSCHAAGVIPPSPLPATPICSLRRETERREETGGPSTATASPPLMLLRAAGGEGREETRGRRKKNSRRVREAVGC
nr:hypothetical protein Iba_chr01bCG10890 [Ipomoea batatas]GMC66526.1 hypothetical protein Iba_chr02eCG6540 [Ipomoea batatas]